MNWFWRFICRWRGHRDICIRKTPYVYKCFRCGRLYRPVTLKDIDLSEYRDAVIDMLNQNGSVFPMLD